DSSRVHVTGNIKFDNIETNPMHTEVQSFRDLMQIDPRTKVLLVGSTQDPEELHALRAFTGAARRHEDLKLILVPRHPDRFDEVWGSVSAEATAAGVKSMRRSRIDQTVSKQDWDILLVDTVGELRWWWGCADLALVGGSFGSRGGQNMLEPAAFGANVAFGPNTSNFRDIVQMLLRCDAAIQLPELEEIPTWLESQLTDPVEGKARGKRAQSVVLQQQGAMALTVELVHSLLNTGFPSSGIKAA
ncbi:MAG: 3-deoxy-D-manno-octulosonic acid transferase, partial [Planctomycetota bacterium]